MSDDFEALVEYTDEMPTGRIPDRVKNKEAAVAFVVWQTKPKSERDLTIAQLSELTGISRQTYYRWRDKNWFQNLCRHEVFKHLADDRREVYDALVEKAKKGDVKAIQTYSDLMGDHVKQIDVTSGGESISDDAARQMTTAELAEELVNERLDDAAVRRMIEDMDASTEEIGALLVELLEE